MPTRTLRTCNACRKPCDGSYCQQHQHLAERTAWASTKGESASQRGYGVEWRRVRAMVLKEQPWCEICQRQLAKQVDHITPLARGGSHERGNLRAVCVGCHSEKTKQDAANGRRTRTQPRGGG
jgi:5-methylcytosine-specific restriction protein A